MTLEQQNAHSPTQTNPHHKHTKYSFCKRKNSEKEKKEEKTSLFLFLFYDAEIITLFLIKKYKKEYTHFAAIRFFFSLFILFAETEFYIRSKVFRSLSIIIQIAANL